MRIFCHFRVFPITLIHAVFFSLAGFGQPIDLNYLPEGSVRIIGGNPAAGRGLIVKNIGDFNGDGLDDLIVSAPFEDRVFMILGKHRFLPTIDLNNLALSGGFPIIGNENSGFGFSISALGDFDGDGRKDVAIGAPFEGEGGRIYILKGTPGFFTSLPVTDEDRFSLIIEGGPGELLGQTIGEGVKIDEDRFNDLIFGNPYTLVERDGSWLSGSVHIIYGRSTFDNRIVNVHELDPASSMTIYGPGEDTDPYFGFGEVFSPVGDLTRDGKTDLGLYLGIPAGAGNESRLLILPGGENYVGNYTLDQIPFPTIPIIFRLFPDPDMHKIDALLAADVNGDGFDDLICGFGLANLYGGTSPTGAVAIIPGRNEPISERTITTVEESEVIWLGHWQVGSGFGQFISTYGSYIGFGAPGVMSPFRLSQNAGAVYVIQGNALNYGNRFDRISTIASSAIYGRAAGNRLGISLDILGDINNDGMLELFVSTPSDGEDDAPAAYIIPARPIRGDINGDHRLNKQDIFFFSANWQNESPSGDIDQSGHVDGYDLLNLLFDLRLN